VTGSPNFTPDTGSLFIAFYDSQDCRYLYGDLGIDVRRTLRTWCRKAWSRFICPRTGSIGRLLLERNILPISINAGLHWSAELLFSRRALLRGLNY
jgi:hypothetical protein